MLTARRADRATHPPLLRTDLSDRGKGCRVQAINVRRTLYRNSNGYPRKTIEKKSFECLVASSLDLLYMDLRGPKGM